MCLQGCFGKPDEADCQIKCGDLYASKAVQTFNTCAVSNKNCVKQKQDTGEYRCRRWTAMAPNRRKRLRKEGGGTSSPG